MRAELGESDEKLTADDDLEKDTEQNTRAFEIMKKLEGAEIHTGKRASGGDKDKFQFMTMYALGDHIDSVNHTTISSIHLNLPRLYLSKGWAYTQSASC
jgi:hypothetical protein